MGINSIVDQCPHDPSKVERQAHGQVTGAPHGRPAKQRAPVERQPCKQTQGKKDGRWVHREGGCLQAPCCPCRPTGGLCTTSSMKASQCISYILQERKRAEVSWLKGISAEVNRGARTPLLCLARSTDGGGAVVGAQTQATHKPVLLPSVNPQEHCP